MLFMVRTRILLLNPEFTEARFKGAPMPLLYAAAPLLDRNREVRIADFSLPKGFIPSFEFKPHIVGITSTSPSHLAACRLASIIKELEPRTLVVKGGIHETYCAETTRLKHPDIDISIRGEGESAFREIVEKFEGGETLFPPIITGNSVADLDKLPFALRNLLADSPFYNFGIFKGRKTAQIMTVRGCPFTCTFCSSDVSVR